MPITVNVAGRVGQIRLPTSKALWPLFETVINSIQSLEESDTKKKVIVIDACSTFSWTAVNNRLRIKEYSCHRK